MKNKASTFMRQVFSAIVNTAKAKLMAVKKKTDSIKARLLIFGLLRDKKFLVRAISHKIHAVLGQEKQGSQDTEASGKAIVIHDASTDDASTSLNCSKSVEPDEGENYPNLRCSLFDMDDEYGDEELEKGTGSVIDLVKNSQEGGSDFNLEGEIDHVADLFIRKFHRQMKMQKLESFRRYQEMLERSV